MKKGRHRRYEEARALKRGPDLDIEAIFTDLESDRPAPMPGPGRRRRAAPSTASMPTIPSTSTPATSSARTRSASGADQRGHPVQVGVAGHPDPVVRQAAGPARTLQQLRRRQHRRGPAPLSPGSSTPLPAGCRKDRWPDHRLPSLNVSRPLRSGRTAHRVEHPQHEPVVRPGRLVGQAVHVVRDERLVHPLTRTASTGGHAGHPVRRRACARAPGCSRRFTLTSASAWRTSPAVGLGGHGG